MQEHALKELEIRFARNQAECSMLHVTQRENGWYDIESAHEINQRFGFPSNERLQRVGCVYPMQIESLVRTVLSADTQGWYHRYLPYGGRQALERNAAHWHINLDINGTIKHWEGVGGAPHGLDNVYGEAVAFGMPALRLDNGDDSFESICRYITYSNPYTNPWHITSYEPLLCDALERSAHEDPHTLHLLIEEFIDDTQRFLAACSSDDRSPESLVADGSESAADTSWQRIDVKAATREQLYSLLNQITSTADAEETVLEAVRTGTLTRWCKRIDALPEVERREQLKKKRQAQAKLESVIDESVRRHAAHKVPFTSYDIAKECDTTPQRASGRIRAFVRRGELVPLEGELPRRYQAA